MTWSGWGAGIAVWGLACGPSVGPSGGDEGGDSGSTEAVSSTASATTATPTTATTVPPPSSSGTTMPPATGSVFLPGNDAQHGGDPCDIWTEDCPAGQKCMPWSSDGSPTWNSTRCVPIDDDPQAVGDPCTMQDSPFSGFDDCDLHAMCWNVDAGTLMGTCVAMCGGSPAAPSCAQSCHECLLGGDGPLALCLAQCDPLIQDCPQGEGCHASADGFACVLLDPDPAGVGDPCAFINECEPSTLCLSPQLVPGCANPSGCCTPFCTTTADTCPVGMHCEPWSVIAAPDAMCGAGPDLGVCIADPG